jgi:hypothetical protein
MKLSIGNFIKGTVIVTLLAATPYLIEKVLSINPLEQKVKNMVNLGTEKINKGFTLEPLMRNIENCEKGYAQVTAAAIIHNQNPEHNIILYAPEEDWSDMQVFMFEQQKKHLVSTPYEPGNFTLQLIPYKKKEILSYSYGKDVKEGLYVYWNNTGGILDTRTNTEIDLEPNTQKKAEKFYNKMQNIVHGMKDKRIDLRKCDIRNTEKMSQEAIKSMGRSTPK